MTSKKVGFSGQGCVNFDMMCMIPRSIIDFPGLYDRMENMKVEPPREQREPKYPTAIKVAAVAACTAVAVLSASCSQQRQQVEDGILPGWVITDSDK